MLIVITLFSILTIASFVWFANQFLPFTVCPLCAGVFLTWVGLMSAHFSGYQITLTIPALLMGGSVVGSMYQLEKKFRGVSANALLLWKMFFVLVGFLAAYSVLEQRWTVLFFAAVFLIAVSFAPLFSSRTATLRKEATGDIEKKMEDCC